MLKYLVCLCDGCCVFCLYCDAWSCRCLCSVMLYVCVLCASCGSSQCCILHDLQFVNAGVNRVHLVLSGFSVRLFCHVIPRIAVEL